MYKATTIISQEAMEEKRTNWREAYGYADGNAHLEHADWEALHAEFVANRPPGSLTVLALQHDGETALCGCITKLDNGTILIQG